MNEIKNSDINIFQKRTFRTKNDLNILGDCFSFNYIQKCAECNKLIDIENISKNFKKMRKDIFWAKCPFCNYIKPEITVIFISQRVEDILPDFDRGMILQNGKIMFSGTKEEVLTEENLKKVFGIDIKLIKTENGRLWSVIE